MVGGKTFIAHPVYTVVPIPGGKFEGKAIEPFLLGKSPVTNELYAGHVNYFSHSPFVLMSHDEATGQTSVMARGESPRQLVGQLADYLPGDWDTRDPFVLGARVLFELRKDMSPKGFDGANQPVVNVSWFHAMEYCLAYNMSLPTDDQWEYAAQGNDKFAFSTNSGKLIDAYGKLAHFNEDTTIDVDDPRYPDGPHGLRHMTGNAWEWTAWNPNAKSHYSIRGGGYGTLYRDALKTFLRVGMDEPRTRSDDGGFRPVGKLTA